MSNIPIEIYRATHIDDVDGECVTYIALIGTDRKNFFKAETLFELSNELVYPHQINWSQVERSVRKNGIWKQDIHMEESVKQHLKIF